MNLKEFLPLVAFLALFFFGGVVAGMMIAPCNPPVMCGGAK